MSVNLIKNFSFEDGFENWSSTGATGSVQVTAAFEREVVAVLSNDPLFSTESIISQLVRIPEGATHFHVVYALRPSILGSGGLQVVVEFRGSANLDPPLPLLAANLIDRVDEGALVELAWQTRYAVTSQIPSDAVWARLRFVHDLAIFGTIQIDAVYMTTD